MTKDDEYQRSGVDDQAAAVSPVEQLDKSLAPSTTDLWEDMKVDKLDKVDGWFWMVGSKGNINPLHHQRVLLREMIPTDRASLHLVWFGRIIYIKPLPDCLLNKRYIKNHIDEHVGKPDFSPASDKTNDSVDPDLLKRTTTGFIKTYCDLIRSPTDLKVAHDLGLVNKNVHWPAWFEYRNAFLAEHKELDTTQRYQFGELRMSRLNIVWRFTGQALVYFTVHREYDTYFQQYFSLFIAAFAIVATILTAMQVLVGIDGIPEPVIHVSYWFGIVAIVIILACLAPVLTLFVGMFVGNVGVALWKKIRGKGDEGSKDPERGEGEGEEEDEKTQ